MQVVRRTGGIVCCFIHTSYLEATSQNIPSISFGTSVYAWVYGCVHHDIVDLQEKG